MIKSCVTCKWDMYPSDIEPCGTCKFNPRLSLGNFDAKPEELVNDNWVSKDENVIEKPKKKKKKKRKCVWHQIDHAIPKTSSGIAEDLIKELEEVFGGNDMETLRERVKKHIGEYCDSIGVECIVSNGYNDGLIVTCFKCGFGDRRYILVKRELGDSKSVTSLLSRIFDDFKPSNKINYNSYSQFTGGSDMNFKNQLIKFAVGNNIKLEFIPGPGRSELVRYTMPWYRYTECSKEIHRDTDYHNLKECLKKEYNDYYYGGRYPYNAKPSIKRVIFNDPATIVFWSDGEKTIVKCAEDEHYDKEKGLAIAISKKFLGTNETKSNFNDIFKKWCEE